MGIPSHRYIRLRSCYSLLLVGSLDQRLVYLEYAYLEYLSSTIPEITDADMAFQAAETHADTEIGPFHKQYRLFHAAFAQFCYTGAQVRLHGLLSILKLTSSRLQSQATSLIMLPKLAQTQVLPSEQSFLLVLRVPLQWDASLALD